jgi:hypothetical protein
MKFTYKFSQGLCKLLKTLHHETKLKCKMKTTLSSTAIYQLVCFGGLNTCYEL